MAKRKRRAADHALRPPMASPGRPTAGRREHRQRFWEEIARGLSSEEAGVASGVSPAVGTRWFRESGGMVPSTLGPVSGRYLSFVEREAIALLRAHGCGVREIGGRLGRSPSTISRELRRNAATRCGNLEYRATTAQWHADRQARRPKVAKLAANEKAEAVCTGPSRWHDRYSERYVYAGSQGTLDRAASRSPPRPTVGCVVEPRTDRE